MKKGLVSLITIILLAGLLVACAGTPVPTAPPPTAPPPTPPVATADSPAVASITGIVWQWQELIETSPAGQSVVPNPDKYVLVIRSDGTFYLQADCHSGNGSYAQESDQLALDLSAITGKVCPPETLHDLYLEKLGQIERYTVEDGRLALILAKDAGRMVFGDGGPAQEGAPSATPHVETPAEGEAALLLDTTWQWAGLFAIEAAGEEGATEAGETEAGAPEAGAYTLVFRPDGGLHIKADCNVGNGTHTLEGRSLTIKPGAMTEAYCGDTSLDSKYLALLGQVTAFKIEDGWLVLSLGDGADRMIFSHGGSAE